MTHNKKNFAIGLVQTAPSPALSGTSLVLYTGQGARMPAVPFYVTVAPQGVLTTLDTAEVLEVTSVTGDTLTIVRACKGTTAKEIGIDWLLANGIYTEDLDAYEPLLPETPAAPENKYLNGNRQWSEILISGTNTGDQVADGVTITGDGTLADPFVGVGSNELITDETPTGDVNGSNLNFTASHAYTPGTMQVYINGVKQVRGTHFTEVGPGYTIFTMSDAPLTGDVISINYQTTISTSGNADTVDGFNANSTPTANQLMALDANAKYSITLISNPYKFRVNRGGNQTGVPDANFTDVIFNTEEFDTNNDFNNSTGVYTVSLTGHYQLSLLLRGQGAGMSVVVIQLVKNGSTVIAKSVNYAPWNDGTATLSGLFKLTAGDTIKAQIYMDVTSGTGTVIGEVNNCWMSGILLSI